MSDAAPPPSGPGRAPRLPAAPGPTPPQRAGAVPGKPLGLETAAELREDKTEETHSPVRYAEGPSAHHDGDGAGPPARQTPLPLPAP